MAWTPPRIQSDVVNEAGGHVTVCGLGKATPMNGRFRGQGSDPVGWQWLKLDFGQSILAKVRNDLANNTQEYNTSSRPLDKRADYVVDTVTSAAPPQQQRLPIDDQESVSNIPKHQGNRSLYELTDEAIRSGFDPAVIGRHIILLSERPQGIELAMGYTAVVAKAKKGRTGRRS